MGSLTARELAERTVERCAPGESAFFEQAARAFYQQKSVRLAKPRRRPEPAGFGVTEVEALVTPVVLSVVTGTASDLLKGWLSREGKGLAGRWKARRARRRPIDPAADAVVPLPRGADLAAFEARAARAAVLLGLSREQAAAMAKVMREELATQGRRE